jgi:methylenetetrahydrofolate reductase (NADPH)
MSTLRASGLGRVFGRALPTTSPRSGLDAAIRSGRFVVTAEVTPPRGADPALLRRKARALKGWVDAVNLTDNAGAFVRMASWAASTTVLSEGLEPVFQLQCRDRNRLAIQSDLLGSSAVGIRNVLLLTGDHMSLGDHPEAKGVYDLDSIQLVWLAATLRDEASLLCGDGVTSAPNWLIGSVENPFAPPRRYRANRLAKKVAGGAEFVQTQFVFDVPAFEAWMAEVVDLGLTEHCAVIAGVGPIRSLRALEHMQHNVAGVVVPESVAKRILGGATAGRVEQEGIELCVETIEQLRKIKGVAGVHVMAYGFEESVPEILARAGIERRPQPAGAEG